MAYLMGETAAGVPKVVRVDSSGRVVLGMSGAALGGTALVHEPGAGTAAVVTLAAAGAGTANALGMVTWSYDADPTGGNLKIEDGSGTTIFSVDITDSGPGFIPWAPPLKGRANTAMIVTLGTAGAAISGKVNAQAWTE